MKVLAAIAVVLVLIFPGWLRAEEKGDSGQNIQQSSSVLTPIVVQDFMHDLSPPLWKLATLPLKRKETEHEAEALRILPKAQNGESQLAPQSMDEALQSELPAAPTPGPVTAFPGQGNQCSCAPPDTNGDVGPNHYFQTVNLKYQIFNKAGASLAGPTNINTIWTGFSGQCATTNNGDPIVLYDPLADRWMVSQFSLASTTGPFAQCIAVSQTGDPTGSYFRYEFHAPNTKFGDYPHYGVWPDGYYLSMNQFSNATAAATWQGAGAVVFERTRMLQGLSAQAVYFDLFSVNSCYGGMLPSDLDGITPPPSGAPNYFMEMDDSTFNCPAGSADNLKIWKFHVDWVTPGNSTFGVGGVHNTLLNTAAFDPNVPCSPAGSRNCIQQLGVAQRVDAITDRLMHRIAYRNDGTTESLVLNHSVNSSGAAAPRWYEIRNLSTTPTIFQQGTFSPDATHRWMGSAAKDHSGDMAVAYSASSSSINPALRFAGRLPGDPAGQLSSETTILSGTGSQNGTSRWGDYSMLTSDPKDDCTFWYTNEFYSANGTAWKTEVGNFKFNQCAPRGAGEPGPILLSKSGGNLVVSWSTLPTGCGNQDYAVYKGSLSSLPSYTHNNISCTTGNAASFSMPMPADSAAYFIVTSESAFDEGSYGRNSNNVERPQSASACRTTQTLGVCN